MKTITKANRIKVILTLFFTLSLVSQIKAQTIDEQMRQNFSDKGSASITINGGIGLGQGFNSQVGSLLFDFPAGVHGVYHFGTFGIGGGARIQKYVGWYDGTGLGNVNYNIVKYFGRLEYFFSEVTHGYIGGSLEGGPVQLLTSNTTIGSPQNSGFFLTGGMQYLIDINHRFSLLLQSNLSFTRFKTTIFSVEVNENILNNQYTIGLRVHL